jgi:uncharacterized protein YndB with AHSA1/START domain
MKIERRLARAGFTLIRQYPAPLERVWRAFAEEDQKLHVKWRFWRAVCGMAGAAGPVWQLAAPPDP